MCRGLGVFPVTTRCACCGYPTDGTLRMEPESWPVCGMCDQNGRPDALRMELYSEGDDAA
jgi:hypothetical protein